MSQTGGKEVGTRTKVEVRETKTCLEGVKFEVDLVRQRVYKPNIKKRMKKVKTQKTWTGSVWSDHGFPSEITKTIHNNARQTNLSSSTKRWMWNKLRRYNKGRYNSPWGWPKMGPSRWDTLKLKTPHDFISIQGTGSYLGCDACWHGWKVRVEYYATTQVKEIYDAGGQEYWTISTPDNEKLLEQHNCHEIKRQCLDKGSKTFKHGLKVTRDCWKEKITYSCQTENIKGCDSLLKKGCTLKKSECVDKSLSPCGQWKRTFECVERRELGGSHLEGSGIYCLDGKCFTPETQKNTDMQSSIAHLAVLQQIQKEMENKNPPTFFKGQNHSCAIHLANFTNCCSSLSGWGCSLGLSNCSEGEKALAKKKSKGLCHYVGTYCAEKIPVVNVCLRKKSVYCCFASKMAKMFHEQGRGQIRRGWGGPKSPDCGPFTADELTKLDFEKMDFSELFEDLFKNLKHSTKKSIPKQIKNQMPVMQKKLNQGGDHVKKTVF